MEFRSNKDRIQIIFVLESDSQFFAYSFSGLILVTAETSVSRSCQELNDAAAAMRKKAFAMIDGKLQSCLRTIEQDAWPGLWDKGI